MVRCDSSLSPFPSPWGSKGEDVDAYSIHRDSSSIISAEFDPIPSTRLGFRRAVPEFLRRPFAFVADRVIKSGLKSQSNPPTMRRMRATICESRRGDRRTACNTCSVELIRYPAVVENICRITIAIGNYGILPK